MIGKQPTMLEQLFLQQFLSPNFGKDVRIHHISENTPHRMQLEIEYRSPSGEVKFDRITIHSNNPDTEFKLP